jgi:glycosyltransferase involved in cell wall biosynthesis
MDSVLSQDGADFELIVVDDCSTDETFAVASSYTDPRVRVLRNETNLGPEGNWNRALALASGTFIKLLPQDDTLLPGMLAEQVAVLEADGEGRIALVFGARDIIGDTGRKIMSRRLRGARPGRIAAADLSRWCVRRGTNVIGEPGAVLFRRTHAERVGRFDATDPYMIDLDYWLRLLAHGDAWYMDKIVSTFRVSAGSWSVAIGKQQGRQYRKFIDRMRARGLVAPGAVDMVLGRAAASINNASRMLLYTLVVR